VLGPILFNIYTRELPNILEKIDNNVSVLAYADDCYISVACDPLAVNSGLESINLLFEGHLNWLQNIGMACNKSKTEVTAFGKFDNNKQIILGNQSFKALPNIKVLGVLFDQKLNFKDHASKVLKKCSSLSYPLYVLNKILPRPIHRQVLYAHFISHLCYASSIWSHNIGQGLLNRLSAALNRVLRYHCFDFDRSLSNLELCTKSNIRSFNSLRIINECKTLFKLVTNPTNFTLTTRLFSQITYSNRFPGKPIFQNWSKRKTGKGSIVNRAKRISEMIPFDWTDISLPIFENRLKTSISTFIR